jgi:hypothetical protein
MASCAHPGRPLRSALLLMLVTTLVVAQGVRPVPPSALAAILADPLATPPAGNARGDVTVVEYFDYNCPVCRHIEPELRQLLASDPKVRASSATIGTMRGASALLRNRLVSSRTTAMVVDIAFPAALSANSA